MPKLKHIVRPGECLISLAARYGQSVESIWNHPDNRTLRDGGREPELLKEGDEVTLETAAPRGNQIDAQQRHTFGAEVPAAWLRLRLVEPVYEHEEHHDEPERRQEGSDVHYEAPRPPDQRSEPLAHVAYRFELGGFQVEGETDGDGVISERIPASAGSQGTLIVRPGQAKSSRLRVLLGYLDPVGEPSGVAQRLRNLGYGPARGDDGLRDGLAAFQRAHELEESGAFDTATKQKLTDMTR